MLPITAAQIFVVIAFLIGTGMGVCIGYWLRGKRLSDQIDNEFKR